MNQIASDTPVSSSASFNPAAPDDLTLDVSVLDSFIADTDFYYQTQDSTYNYHVVWLKPRDNDKFDLSLWNDSGYSQYLSSSNLGNGALNWIVYYGSDRIYPRSHAYIGSSGNLDIEWDAALPSSLNLGYSDALSITDQIELYYFSLEPSKAYNFTLDVPLTGDFALFLYGGLEQRGDALNPTEYLALSNTSGLGTDELIANFTPATAGIYVALIVRYAGDGSYEFKYFYATPEPGGIPGFAGSILLFGLLVLIINPIRKIFRGD